MLMDFNKQARSVAFFTNGRLSEENNDKLYNASSNEK